MNYIETIKAAVAAHSAGEMSDTVFMTTVNTAMNKYKVHALRRTVIHALPSRMGVRKPFKGRKAVIGKALEN